jgi:Rer1 family
MGWYCISLLPLLRQDIIRSGMVHRYVESRFSKEVTHHSNTFAVAYTLCIYLLNIFLAFISPKFDPSLELDEGMEDGTAGGLPTKADDEFRPFVRRLPEFKFWLSATRAIVIGLVCCFFTAFDLPVFWPVLVMYFCILFVLTSMRLLEHCINDKLLTALTVRRQIQHMIKYRYVPFTVGKTRYGGSPGK